MVPNRIPLPGLCLGLGPASWLAQLNCSSFLSDPGEPPDSSAGCPQPSTTFLPAVAASKLKLLHSAWPVLLPHLHSSRAWQWAPAHRMSSGQAWKWLAGCIEPRYQTWCSPLLATDVPESSSSLSSHPKPADEQGRALTDPAAWLGWACYHAYPQLCPTANLAMPWPGPSHNRISSLQQSCALSRTL